jgi:hypothetical protein
MREGRGTLSLRYPRFMNRNRKARIQLRVLLVAILSVLSLGAHALPPQGSPAWSVRTQPVRLVNGSPMLLRITPPVRLQSLAAKWLQHDVFFSLDPKRKAWYGLGGVSLETLPGVYALQLTGTTTSGKEISEKDHGQARRLPQRRGDSGQEVHRARYGTGAGNRSGQNDQARCFREGD